MIELTQCLFLLFTYSLFHSINWFSFYTVTQCPLIVVVTPPSEEGGRCLIEAEIKRERPKGGPIWASSAIHITWRRWSQCELGWNWSSNERGTTVKEINPHTHELVEAVWSLKGIGFWSLISLAHLAQWTWWTDLLWSHVGLFFFLFFFLLT